MFAKRNPWFSYSDCWYIDGTNINKKKSIISRKRRQTSWNLYKSFPQQDVSVERQQKSRVTMKRRPQAIWSDARRCAPEASEQRDEPWNGTIFYVYWKIQTLFPHPPQSVWSLCMRATIHKIPIWFSSVFETCSVPDAFISLVGTAVGKCIQNSCAGKKLNMNRWWYSTSQPTDADIGTGKVQYHDQAASDVLQFSK